VVIVALVVATKVVALPTLVTSPVRLAFVVTVPAVKPAAVPVMFVPTKAEGVPRAGVTRVGLVARTTEPEPVVLAAEMAVPLPCRMPVTVVESVIAGVLVAVATVPANPLADTTETLVTVPPEPLGAAHVPSARKKLVVPPPDDGARPFKLDVNTGRIALT